MTYLRKFLQYKNLKNQLEFLIFLNTQINILCIKYKFLYITHIKKIKNLIM